MTTKQQSSSHHQHDKKKNEPGTKNGDGVKKDLDEYLSFFATSAGNTSMMIASLVLATHIY
jgi:hypothetical protein